MKSATQKSMGKQAGFFFLGRLVSYGINFIVFIAIARILGANSFGIFSLATSILIFSFMISNLGIENSIPYFVPKNKGNARNILNTTIKIRIITALVSSITLFLLSDLIGVFYNLSSLGIILKWMSLTLFAYSIIYFLPAIFQALKKLEYSMISDFLQSVFKIVMIPLCIYLGVIGATYGYAFAIILPCIIMSLLLLRILPKKISNERSRVTRILKYSLISYAGVISAYIAGYVSNLIMGFYPEQVAFLSLGQRIGLVLILPASALSTALFPEISSSLSKKKIKSIFNSITHYQVLITSFICFGIIAITAPFVNLFLKQDYLPGVFAIQVILLGFLINGVFYSFSALFYGTNKPKVLTNAGIIKGVIGVILAFTLVTFFKAVGAGIAILASELVFGYYLSIKSSRIKINYNFKMLGKTLICGLAGLVSILIFIDNGVLELIARLICFTIIFTLTGVLLKVITKREINMIKKFTKVLKTKTAPKSILE